MRPRASAPPTVALYAAGQLPAYLRPTLVGRLTGGLGLTSTQAGALGSTLLLASAAAALLLAGRVTALGPGRTARTGLGLLGLGCALAATGPHLPLLAAALATAGLGAGTAIAVATTALAGAPDPHRTTVRALLATSGTAAGLYLLLPHFGTGPAAPFTAVALTALAAAVPTGGRPDRRSGPARALRRGTPVKRGAGTRTGAAVALILTVPFWSMAQNALWGISGQLGHRQAGLGEGALGLVFALALFGGLLGVTAAGALGSRIGRALPIGLGTLVIAGCALLTGTARGPVAFTTGELLWNLLHPLVLSHLLGLAAALDPSGRRAVQTTAASALGVACGPLVGTALASGVGYPGTGALLAALLAVGAGPLTLAALPRGPRRSLVPGPASVRPPRRRTTGRRPAGTGPAVRRTVAHPAPARPTDVRPVAARPVVRIPEQRRPAPTAHPDEHPDSSRTARSGYASSSARNSASRSTPDGSSLT
ncbi:MFS transporter [Kitasatospora cineracea]|uniref:MFS transporter n=1 Tax=Kitasatospora cineracea TaxID=88074 RepID=UPI0033D6EC04